MTQLTANLLEHQDQWVHDLRTALLHYARIHDAMLEEHEALIRMFIGEAQRHPHESFQVLQQTLIPLREKFAAYLSECIQRGSVRTDIDPTSAADRFTGMLLAGMLRRHVMPIDRGYSRDEYIEGCVDLCVRGIGTEGSTPSSTQIL
jgi:hypothetical protein